MNKAASIGVVKASATESVCRIGTCFLPALTVVLVGCAELPYRLDDPLLPGGKIDRLVVADFAATLADSHEPFTTTFQVSRDTRDPVTTRLVERLVELGFGIQRVPQDQGAHFIEHQRDIVLPRRGGTRIVDRLTIGRFKAQRTFTLTADGDIESTTPQQIGDVVRAALESTDQATAAVASPPASTPIAGTTNRVLSWPTSDLLDSPRPLIQVVTREVVEGVAAAATGGSSLSDRSAADLTRRPTERTDGKSETKSIEPNNRFYGGDSVFADKLDGFDRIERRTIVFANDSLQLGRTNKRLLARWLTDRFHQNDRLSLIGCSTGKTALAIGNEGLALGRADRVIEELESHGVDRQAIFSEGCWAPVSAGDVFPGRGVILELWRRKS